jgi:hypothetical protein
MGTRFVRTIQNLPMFGATLINLKSANYLILFLALSHKNAKDVGLLVIKIYSRF